MAATYPFAYINHGQAIDVYSFDGTLEIFIWFKEPINPTIKKQTMKDLPVLLKKFSNWGKQYAYIGNFFNQFDDILKLYMKQQKIKTSDIDWNDKEIFKKLEKNAIEAFVQYIEKWIMDVHEKIAPISFFISLPRITGSKWNTWSYKKMDTEIFKPVSTFLQNNTLKPTDLFIIKKMLEQLTTFLNGANPNDKTKSQKLAAQIEELVLKCKE